MALSAGTRLGPYEIVRVIGAGGMGEVYRARDTRLDRVVAIKVLPEALTADPARRQRFEREARTISRLNHPNVCTLHDIGRQGDVDYLVMELVEGETLKTRLDATGALPLEAVVAYARQVAEGLASAHARGVVHRDLKPSNLVITPDDRVKILDFGIAKIHPTAPLDAADTVVDQTTSGIVLGTVGYMAPEQVEGHDPDHRVDLFAWGVLCYEMLSGRRAFKRGSSVATLHAILYDDPEPLPASVPGPLADLVGRCLAKTPGDRPATAAALLEALADTMEPAPAPTPEAAGGVPSIGVLPFADLSPERDQDYFCEGMAEEIIDALTGAPGIRVASRTSSFRFKGQPGDVREIGRRLQVATLLEGSVRKAGRRLRITARHVDVAHGYEIWSERFDRDLDDVFAIQDEIARALVDRLRAGAGSDAGDAAAVSTIVGRPTDDLEAYSLFLKGRYAAARLTGDGIATSIRFFRDAVAHAPRYAQPYAGLARSYTLQAILSWRPPREVMPAAAEAAATALTLADTLAEAHRAQAMIRHWYEWDWAGAEQAYRRALDLNPGDVDTRASLALMLAHRLRPDEAVAEAQRAVELDPASLNANRTRAEVELGHDIDAAVAWANTTLELEPRYFPARWALAAAHVARGECQAAIAGLEAGRRDAAGTTALEAMLGWAYGLAGRHDEAREILAALTRRRADDYCAANWIGVVHAGLGDYDEAVAWCERACHDREPTCTSYLLAEWAAGLRRQPAFRDLLKRHGLD